MNKPNSVFKILLVSQIQQDKNQPRKDFGEGIDRVRLESSIKRYGIQQPIVVTSRVEGWHTIIDGHRRYRAAKSLGINEVPSIIVENISDKELESLRYELQNNRRDWKPVERSESLSRIKRGYGFSSNKELGELLGLSSSVIADSLNLRNQRLAYLNKMASYDLSEAYQVELTRILPKLKKTSDFEVDDALDIILVKIRDRVIKNAKDLRKLGRVYLRAQINEAEIAQFLSEKDITIKELESKTESSGLAREIQLTTDTLRKAIDNKKIPSGKQKVLLSTLISKAQELLKMAK